jgi:hypothetical protein
LTICLIIHSFFYSPTRVMNDPHYLGVSLYDAVFPCFCIQYQIQSNGFYKVSNFT